MCGTAECVGRLSVWDGCVWDAEGFGRLRGGDGLVCGAAEGVGRQGVGRRRVELLIRIYECTRILRIWYAGCCLKKNSDCNRRRYDEKRKFIIYN